MQLVGISMYPLHWNMDNTSQMHWNENTNTDVNVIIIHVLYKSKVNINTTSFPFLVLITLLYLTAVKKGGKIKITMLKSFIVFNGPVLLATLLDTINWELAWNQLIWILFCFASETNRTYTNVLSYACI